MRLRRQPLATREAQLQALDRKLVKIAAILLVALVVFELVGRPGFSPGRLLLSAGVILLGLLFGRTLGKLLFLRRD